jgi:hypothetical protein
MMPMGKGGMGGMHGGGMMDEAPEPDLDADAKVEAIRSALRELVQIVGGISVEEAKAKKAAPAVKVEVEPEEE